MIDITGIDKATLLTALYNSSKPLAMGFIFSRRTLMSKEDAQRYIDRGQTSFGYLEGRAMNIDISGDQMDPQLYDSCNRPGAAKRVVEMIKESQEVAFNLQIP